MRLIAENLTVMRGERAVIDALSFDVQAGEALLLTGANGSGKTTLIRTIAGLLRPEAGSIRLEGGDVELTLGEQCHYVGHLTGTKASLSAAANLAFWADYLEPRAGRAGSRARAAAALERLDLASLADIPAAYLSAGQRRRLGLARILVAARPVWLLDEPTVSLDAASTTHLAQIIAEHLAGGGLLVAATHLPLGIENAKYLRLGAAQEAA